MKTEPVDMGRGWPTIHRPWNTELFEVLEWFDEQQARYGCEACGEWSDEARGKLELAAW